MPSRARDWLRQAERNLRSAEVNYQNGLYEETCYESQQTAEKAVKALLNHLHREEKGSAITLLLQQVTVEILGVMECAQELDKHYIPSRYPDAYAEGAPLDFYNRANGERCMECARMVLDWVRSHVDM
ncbi:hypothetical protein L3N51_01477 [Metallosphaera sp. J1]|uniref:HEPN domain-containing protein n=1 Tax=Metallosphaera javensis (ex Hofmann et al. 2022) TaxID=99938 RepID=UPI001EDDD5C1|nr:HEPN domain-containing protein [Metallosphaera javensis (ex Hofmann et al. 2022)]MCG3109187.1 hypothetical protein [Metallosphaera javensis (ex Hofmann et al. 2022)]